MWEVPKYIRLFNQDLAVVQAWIATGGTTATLGPVYFRPASDGKSEADESDEELMPASRLFPKVQQDDQMRHKLDRGAWEETPAVRQGDQILIQVHFLSVPVFLLRLPSGAEDVNSMASDICKSAVKTADRTLPDFGRFETGKTSSSDRSIGLLVELGS